ncbi:MAG: hypothetical protein OYL97_05000 [Candidatus Poribacteria bacterium]|nr:hypothetical protein [Candidatus Poribacteria bacterium]
MSEKLQGFEEYTPSRLEWLVVMLNSMVNYLNASPEGSSAVYAYILGRDRNTIIMHMKYFADLPPELVEVFEENGKKLAITIAKNYKWDSWLEIQTQLEPINRPPEK